MPEDPHLNISYEIQDWQKNLPDIDSLITKTINIAYEMSDKPKKLLGKATEISLVFSNDDDVQKINKEFRDQDKPTNVLSFPQFDMNDFENEITLEIYPLGDIIFAYETLIQESEADENKDFKSHLTHLTIHGLLHLMGYDHEFDDEAEIMENLEIKIMKRLGYNNPYQIL